MSEAFCLAIMIGGLAILSSVEVDAQSTVDDSASCDSTFDEAVHLIREDLKDVKNLLGSNQQRNNATCISKKELEDLKVALSSNLQQWPLTEPSSSKQALVSSFLSDCIPLLIQQSVDGSDVFNRVWAEFKVGFNDTRGNYWLGNELLHQLTHNGRYRLRFDLQERTNLSWYYAEYSSFVVLSEAYNYMLLVSGYSGNAGDALVSQDKMMFTTYDRDNDPYSDRAYKNNCAVYNGGGFWYKNCGSCRVNSDRSRGFFYWKWFAPERRHLYLKSTRMWLTC